MFDEPSTQYPIPTRLNLLIIAAQLMATAAVFYAASRAQAWWQLGLLSLAFAIVGNSIYAVIHEAHHRILHPNPRVNDAMGVLMSLLFPAAFHLIRQGHLGHHIRNRSDDEAFDYYFETEIPLLKWVQLYGTITGLFWCTVALSNPVVLLCPWVLKRRYFELDRPSAAFMQSLNPVYWRAIKLEALAAIALHGLIIWALAMPLWNYFIVYFGFGFSWSAMQYVHHFDTPRHVTDGARNLRFVPLIDAIWLNHNWHLTHHQRPTVPWLYLPVLAGGRSARRESMLWHYLRMWRGPRRATEHVENKYAGHVIR